MLWINKPFFQYATGALIVVVTLYYLGKIGYIVNPLQEFIATIFFPLILSGLFYYLLRPVVHFLSRFLSRAWSVIVLFIVLAAGGFAAIYFGGSVLASQMKDLTEDFPERVTELSSQPGEILESYNISFIEDADLEEKAVNYISSIFENTGETIFGILNAVTNVAVILVVVPFLLFFLLRDEGKIKASFQKMIPAGYEEEGNEILEDVDQTLSTYVIGQFLVAVSVGVLMYIGFWVIGIEYRLALALFPLILEIIPFFGPILGIIPALLVALLDSPGMVVKVIILTLIVQQLQSNLISPYIMGKKLHLHPAIVILLLLVGGSLYGFVGILIAVPLYSVLRVLIKDFWKIYKLRKREDKIIT
ncbi:AI-2E family transporter [Mesobacillus subterraneus]|uniref:AI-2E family transporter n=1 Tax=Mesobacillus subterraneus TaxID=285983 RepID=A0A3R9FFJ1_9BACI|nr:AI-2E family transporter [Mesobacillus subterraneus]RSD26883.1 AI-2E family transporter [Mesobacillus subterraneus]